MCARGRGEKGTRGWGGGYKNKIDVRGENIRIWQEGENVLFGKWEVQQGRGRGGVCTDFRQTYRPVTTRLPLFCYNFHSTFLFIIFIMFFPTYPPPPGPIGRQTPWARKCPLLSYRKEKFTQHKFLMKETATLCGSWDNVINWRHRSIVHLGSKN